MSVGQASCGYWQCKDIGPYFPGSTDSLGLVGQFKVCDIKDFYFSKQFLYFKNLLFTSSCLWQSCAWSTLIFHSSVGKTIQSHEVRHLFVRFTVLESFLDNTALLCQGILLLWFINTSLQNHYAQIQYEYFFYVAQREICMEIHRIILIN